MSLLVAVNDPMQWAFLGLLVVMIAAMLWGARTKQKRLAAMPRRPTVDLRKATDVRDTMERLMVELHEVSREMNARLDTKLATLSELVSQADRRIQHLQSLVDASQAHASADPSRPSGTQKGPPADGLSAPPAAAEEDSRYREIYAMFDGGMAAHQIAKKTGKLTGEVELILGLRTRAPVDQTRLPDGAKPDP